MLQLRRTRAHHWLVTGMVSSPARRKMSSLNSSLLSDAPIVALRSVISGEGLGRSDCAFQKEDVDDEESMQPCAVYLCCRIVVLYRELEANDQSRCLLTQYRWSFVPAKQGSAPAFTPEDKILRILSHLPEHFLFPECLRETFTFLHLQRRKAVLAAARLLAVASQLGSDHCNRGYIEE